MQFITNFSYNRGESKIEFPFLVQSDNVDDGKLFIPSLLIFRSTPPLIFLALHMDAASKETQIWRKMLNLFFDSASNVWSLKSSFDSEHNSEELGAALGPAALGSAVGPALGAELGEELGAALEENGTSFCALRRHFASEASRSGFGFEEFGTCQSNISLMKALTSCARSDLLCP